MKKIVLVFALLLCISFQINAQWQNINSPVASINDMLILSDGTILIGTGNGLFISNDNFLSWDSTSITNNVNLTQKDNLGNIYASALESVFNPPGYLFRSTDLGLTWTVPYDLIPDNPYNVQNIFINDSGYIFTIQGHGGSSGWYTTVLKSTDFGSSWNLIYYMFCACEQTGLGFSMIENVTGTLFVSDMFILYPQYWLLYSIRRKEQGGNWTTFANTFASNMYLYNNELYISCASIYSSFSLGIIKSSDDGNSFVQLNNGFSDLNIKQLILKPEVFIALNGNEIYRSLDEGNNWIGLDHTGLNGNINRIYLDDNQTLYACTNNGIYVFTGELPVELLSFTATEVSGSVTLNWSTATELNNHGFEIERSLNKTTWATIGFKEGKGTTSEPQQYFYSDDISEISSSKLFYRLKQIDFNGSFDYSDIVEVEIAPTNFSLEQNYPNPFNPSTKISWQSPVGSWQTLKVYDILGNEVAILVNEYKPAGSYNVEFRMQNSELSSGIYFYQLNAGDPSTGSGQVYVETKKMILLK